MLIKALIAPWWWHVLKYCLIMLTPILSSYSTRTAHRFLVICFWGNIKFECMSSDRSSSLDDRGPDR
uniref:Putative secreted protein n=1 Tax=Anopheles darlingi TaxID=43151 RepID=A0A2M4DBT0_ANODA